MSIRTLYEKVENELISASSPGIHPGLERISKLLELLGHPESAFPAIHVVGTNGKGSTSAYVESILRSSGMHVALYTSPHLVHMGERLLLDGKMLSPETWKKAARKVIKTIGQDKRLSEDPPTFFEVFTAAAFVIIADSQVDAAVIEAGMGGRLDASNTLTKVLITIITSISKDHMDFLGDTLEAIAMEKFAVIRPGVPAVFAGGAPSLCTLFAKECQKKGAPGVVLPHAYSFTTKGLSIKGATFTLHGKDGIVEYTDLHTPLLGVHQVSNSSLAVASMDILKRELSQITEQTIRQGLTQTHWRGRMELLPTHPPIMLDGAHNDDGIARLVESLNALEINGSKVRLTIVYGSMKDKEHNVALHRLSQLQPQLICTEVPGMERSAKASALQEEAALYKWANEPEGIPDPVEALQKAQKNSDIIVCCGSLYLIGYVQTHMAEGARFL